MQDTELTYCVGNVSEATQNLIIGQASIATFLRQYLDRQITVDTQAVVQGIQPQTALMRAACTMSCSIDHRRPQQLTPEQSASVNNNPFLRSLLNRREQLKRTTPNATKHPKYKALASKINQERQRQRHALLQAVKERWEFEQPVGDVEQQLASGRIKDNPELAHYAMPPTQVELVGSVLSQPGTTVEEELCRRNRAIRAVMLYCRLEEGGMNPTRMKREKEKPSPLAKIQLEYKSEALEAAKVSVYKETRPRICFVCLGNENLPTDARTYSFHTSGDLSKHFKRKHLQHIKEGEPLGCELCQVSLESKMHLQRHAHDIHGTVSFSAT
jgi:hypothetical protein